MFKNATKKFIAIGLAAVICVPSYSTFAQPIFNMDEVDNSSKNHTNQQNFRQYNPFLTARQQAANPPIHTRQSALERLWNEYGARNSFSIQGRHFATAAEFATELRRTQPMASVSSRSILQHLIVCKEASLPIDEALVMTQETITEIYNLQPTEAKQIANQALKTLRAHPILGKLIFK